jgi:hypothetical protein
MSDTIKPRQDNPNAAWTPKVSERLQEQVDALMADNAAAVSAADNAALRERVAVLKDALKSADAAFESAEIFLPNNCPQEFAFYAGWEEVRAALKGASHE